MCTHSSLQCALRKLVHRSCATQQQGWYVQEAFIARGTPGCCTSVHTWPLVCTYNVRVCMNTVRTNVFSHCSLQGNKREDCAAGLLAVFEPDCPTAERASEEQRAESETINRLPEETELADSQQPHRPQQSHTIHLHRLFPSVRPSPFPPISTPTTAIQTTRVDQSSVEQKTDSSSI